ncbi:MAG: hypothetical protein ACEQSA_02575 [Weeksellaceae bacterium]
MTETPQSHEIQPSSIEGLKSSINLIAKPDFSATPGLRPQELVDVKVTTEDLRNQLMPNDQSIKVIDAVRLELTNLLPSQVAEKHKEMIEKATKTTDGNKTVELTPQQTVTLVEDLIKDIQTNGLADLAVSSGKLGLNADHVLNMIQVIGIDAGTQAIKEQVSREVKRRKIKMHARGVGRMSTGFQRDNLTDSPALELDTTRDSIRKTTEKKLKNDSGTELSAADLKKQVINNLKSGNRTAVSGAIRQFSQVVEQNPTEVTDGKYVDSPTNRMRRLVQRKLRDTSLGLSDDTRADLQAHLQALKSPDPQVAQTAFNESSALLFDFKSTEEKLLSTDAKVKQEAVTELFADLEEWSQVVFGTEALARTKEVDLRVGVALQDVLLPPAERMKLVKLEQKVKDGMKRSGNAVSTDGDTQAILGKLAFYDDEHQQDVQQLEQLKQEHRKAMLVAFDVKDGDQSIVAADQVSDETKALADAIKTRRSELSDKSLSETNHQSALDILSTKLSFTSNEFALHRVQACASSITEVLNSKNNDAEKEKLVTQHIQALLQSVNVDPNFATDQEVRGIMMDVARTDRVIKRLDKSDKPGASKDAFSDTDRLKLNGTTLDMGLKGIDYLYRHAETTETEETLTVKNEVPQVVDVPTELPSYGTKQSEDNTSDIAAIDFSKPTAEAQQAMTEENQRREQDEIAARDEVMRNMHASPPDGEMPTGERKQLLTPVAARLAEVLKTSYADDDSENRPFMTASRLQERIDKQIAEAKDTKPAKLDSFDIIDIPAGGRLDTIAMHEERIEERNEKYDLESINKDKVDNDKIEAHELKDYFVKYAQAIQNNEEPPTLPAKLTELFQREQTNTVDQDLIEQFQERFIKKAGVSLQKDAVFADARFVEQFNKIYPVYEAMKDVHESEAGIRNMQKDLARLKEVIGEDKYTEYLRWRQSVKNSDISPPPVVEAAPPAPTVVEASSESAPEPIPDQAEPASEADQQTALAGVIEAIEGNGDSHKTLTDIAGVPAETSLAEPTEAAQLAAAEANLDAAVRDAQTAPPRRIFKPTDTESDIKKSEIIQSGPDIRDPQVRAAVLKKLIELENAELDKGNASSEIFTKSMFARSDLTQWDGTGDIPSIRRLYELGLADENGNITAELDFDSEPTETDPVVLAEKALDAAHKNVDGLIRRNADPADVEKATQDMVAAQAALDKEKAEAKEDESDGRTAEILDTSGDWHDNLPAAMKAAQADASSTVEPSGNPVAADLATLEDIRQRNEIEPPRVTSPAEDLATLQEIAARGNNSTTTTEPVAETSQAEASIAPPPPETSEPPHVEAVAAELPAGTPTERAAVYLKSLPRTILIEQLDDILNNRSTQQIGYALQTWVNSNFEGTFPITDAGVQTLVDAGLLPNIVISETNTEASVQSEEAAPAVTETAAGLARLKDILEKNGIDTREPTIEERLASLKKIVDSYPKSDDTVNEAPPVVDEVASSFDTVTPTETEATPEIARLSDTAMQELRDKVTFFKEVNKVPEELTDEVRAYIEASVDEYTGYLDKYNNLTTDFQSSLLDRITTNITAHEALRHKLQIADNANIRTTIEARLQNLSPNDRIVFAQILTYDREISNLSLTKFPIDTELVGQAYNTKDPTQKEELAQLNQELDNALETMEAASYALFEKYAALADTHAEANSPVTIDADTPAQTENPAIRTLEQDQELVTNYLDGIKTVDELRETPLYKKMVTFVNDPDEQAFQAVNKIRKRLKAKLEKNAPALTPDEIEVLRTYKLTDVVAETVAALPPAIDTTAPAEASSVAAPESVPLEGNPLVTAAQEYFAQGTPAKADILLSNLTNRYPRSAEDRNTDFAKMVDTIGRKITTWKNTGYQDNVPLTSAEIEFLTQEKMLPSLDSYLDNADQSAESPTPDANYQFIPAPAVNSPQATIPAQNTAGNDTAAFVDLSTGELPRVSRPMTLGTSRLGPDTVLPADPNGQPEVQTTETSVTRSPMQAVIRDLNADQSIGSAPEDLDHRANSLPPFLAQRAPRRDARGAVNAIVSGARDARNTNSLLQEAAPEVQDTAVQQAATDVVPPPQAPAWIGNLRNATEASFPPVAEATATVRAEPPRVEPRTEQPTLDYRNAIRTHGSNQLRNLISTMGKAGKSDAEVRAVGSQLVNQIAQILQERNVPEAEMATEIQKLLDSLLIEPSRLESILRPQVPPAVVTQEVTTGRLWWKKTEPKEITNPDPEYNTYLMSIDGYRKPGVLKDLITELANNDPDEEKRISNQLYALSHAPNGSDDAKNAARHVDNLIFLAKQNRVPTSDQAVAQIRDYLRLIKTIETAGTNPQ